MFDLLTVDLLFTLAACFSLLILWAASAAILPWTESELDQVEADFRGLADQLIPADSSAPATAAWGGRRR